MADPSKWDADPKKQAEFLESFRNSAAEELAAIKRRLVLLLMPAFFILLAVLGLTVLTWMKVNELQHEGKIIAKTLDDIKKSKRVGEAEPKPKPIVLATGLDDAQRQEFYHLAEGSEVFPLDWLKAMENKKTGKLFLDDVESMGFIADPDNKDGLPVGLTADSVRGLEPMGRMVGLNCAACHVGEMTYKGHRVRIDGAPNFLNTRTFFASLIESAEATADDPDKLLAFIDRLKEERGDQKETPSKVRTAARSVLAKLAGKADDVLKETLVPFVKKVVEKAKADKTTFDLEKSPNAANPKPGDLRTRLLKDFEPGAIKDLVKNEKLAARLESLVDKVEHEGTILHTLEEIYIGIRLMRARVVFLKKLAPVGADPRTDWGPGRVDAFGSARAFLFEDGYAPINPVSYPFIWGLKKIDWFHYDNNTTSILERNFGQALGVGAVYDPKTYASTLKPMNLHRLEELARLLTPPKWPEDALGKIDPESAKRGAVHYAEHCAKCHDAPKDGFMEKNLFSVTSVGTDPERAKMFAEKLPKGPFKDKLFADAIGEVMAKIKTQSMEENGLTKEQRALFDKPVANWRGPNEYSSRPLAGVWATGPFLHNGSVPTLDDLLQPADKRPSKFRVGNREFDPAKLGYLSDGETNYDTSVVGNSNKGHEYGAKLKDDERKDLLEYLKSL